MLPSLPVFKAQQVPLHPEDQMILEIARELFRELRIVKFNPTTVSWVEKYGYVKMPYDGVVFLRDQLLLSKKLTGLFQPAEWKAFLATNLLYRSKSAGALIWGMASRILLPFVAIVIGVQLFDRFLSAQYEFLRVALLLPLSFGYLAVAFFSLFRSFKRLWFEFDFKAAQVVGRENLIAALRKLESLETMQTGRVFRQDGKPSLAARISRLQQAQTP